MIMEAFLENGFMFYQKKYLSCGDVTASFLRRFERLLSSGVERVRIFLALGCIRHKYF